MRVLHYSHDDYGSDHLERTLDAAKQIAFEFPEATQLVVTGSPQPRDKRLPKGVDYIKLPNMDESSKIEGHTPSLLLPYGAIKTMRETLISGAIQSFKPDVVLVETREEARGEICEALDQLHEQHGEAQLVLGMGETGNAATVLRDVVAGAESALPRFLTGEEVPCEAEEYQEELESVLVGQ